MVPYGVAGVVLPEAGVVLPEVVLPEAGVVLPEVVLPEAGVVAGFVAGVSPRVTVPS
jgi:hypothetical protein